MSKLRRWLLLSSAGWFFAGIMVGLAWPRLRLYLTGPVQVQDGEEQDIRQLIVEYGLTRDQQELVRVILAGKRRDREQIFYSIFDQLPKGSQHQWREAMQKAEQRLEFILTDAQRQKFQRAKHGDGK